MSDLQDLPENPEPLNPLFRLVIVAGGVFVMTILAYVATIFGDPRAPAARLLDDYIGWLIIIEVAAILFIGWLALAFDKTKVLRNERRKVECRERNEGE
jgi:cytochrome c biogenesis protein CcdA